MNYGYISTPNLQSYSLYQGTKSTIPEEYKIKDLGVVLNQGNQGSCVSCSIYEMYHFYCLSKHKKLDIPYTYTYDNRKDKSIDGQNPGEAFTFMKDKGKISVFSRINTLDTLKDAIVANGPCLIAMIAKSNNDNFWIGDKTLGGHAVTTVGYTKDSLIIKNSWGYEYGNNGYYYLPFDEFNVIKEAWIIIN